MAEKSNQNYKRTERSERLKAYEKTWSATAACEDRKKIRSQRMRAACRHWKQPMATASQEIETSVLQLNATEFGQWPGCRFMQFPEKNRALLTSEL